MGVTKIATCCYCGTKAALVLRGKERHELTCATCGAPLHAMKMLPVTPDRPAKPVKAKYSQPRPKKRKKSKPRRKQMISRIWDVIEDVLDEVFD